jgi:hypothetical protein
MANQPSSAASRLPIGLLGALGIKTLGRYPESLADNYQSTIEILNFLHAAVFQASRVTGINYDLATVGNNLHTDLGFIVPNSEVWYVPARCYNASFSGLTATFGSALCVVMSGGAGFDAGMRYVSTTDLFPFASWTANGRPRQSNDVAFFAGPGSTFGWVNALGAVGPAATAIFQLQALRMPA